MIDTTLTVLLIVATIGGFVEAFLWWRSRCTGDVRRVVVSIRELLQEAVSVGGLDSSRFLEAGAGREEQELEDLVGRVNDRSLRDSCRRVLEAYRKAWASSPVPMGPRVYTLTERDARYHEEDRARDTQREREVVYAGEGVDAIADVLARVNALERFLPRRD